jgi:hypothetical protein
VPTSLCCMHRLHLRHRDDVGHGRPDEEGMLRESSSQALLLPPNYLQKEEEDDDVPTPLCCMHGLHVRHRDDVGHGRPEEGGMLRESSSQALLLPPNYLQKALHPPFALPEALLSLLLVLVRQHGRQAQAGGDSVPYASSPSALLLPPSLPAETHLHCPSPSPAHLRSLPIYMPQEVAKRGEPEDRLFLAEKGGFC